MDAPPASQDADLSHRVFRDELERAAIDAAFLWWLRSINIDQPHTTPEVLAELEDRLDAQLDALMTSLDLGWEICEAALQTAQSGEVFTAAVVAMRSHDTGKIQIAVETGLTNPETLKALISAFGWLPAAIAQPWIERLLKGKDMNHKYLGVAACSVRRENPGEFLNDILKRDDCRAHGALYTRALRLVGELRRQDLMPALHANLTANDPALVFWATWSSILLGQHQLAKNLLPFILKPGPFQSRALQIAFRVLPVGEARELISSLAKDPANARAVIIATGVLGDPHAVNWLISKMTEPKFARLAGEAFAFITGIDFEKHDLKAARPADQTPIPNDNPQDTDVGLDPDEHLSWPHAEKIAALWRNHGQHFLVGRRYFLGKPISPEWLKQVLAQGFQRQRHAAALELALVDSQSRLVNTRARAGA